MTSLVTSQTHVGCLVARTVLGRSGKQFQREAERLINHNGPEWVATRFKALWNAANHLRNGDRESARAVYQENGISYHKSDLTPKGPFRPAVRGYVLAQRPSVIKRHAAVLRFYTSIQLPSLSDKQSKKAYESIQSSSWKGTEAGREKALLHLSLTKNSVLRALRKKGGCHWEPRISSRYANGLHASSYYYSPLKGPKGWRDEPYGPMVLSFISTAWLPESLDYLTPCRELRLHLRKSIPRDPHVGKITVLQEQGAKARVVAMPTAWLQLAFMPLHNRLASVAEHAFPDASCVKDQLKGVHGVLRHMQEGKPVFCTDLSSATDRFPRSYSLALLEGLGMSNYAEALEQVCERTFDSPWGPISYGTGQPMGLYGSFPLFHLSNLMVADAVERETIEKVSFWNKEDGGIHPPVSLFQNGRAFYVLGDDIVFSDERVADNYRLTMSELDVPISEHKSFKGNLAEFAGFMVTQTREGAVAFRPYKNPSGSEVSNPISFLDSLGSKASNISKYWSRKWDQYSVTAGHRGLDLSPLVPDNVGGPYTNVYRGDSQTLVNLSNVLTAQMGDQLPDLSGSTKINTIPMFSERGIFDFYGFNPEELKRLEKSEKDSTRHRVQTRLRDDPVMKLYEPKRGSVGPSVSSEPPPPPTVAKPVKGQVKAVKPITGPPLKGEASQGRLGPVVKRPSWLDGSPEPQDQSSDQPEAEPEF